MPNKQVVLAGEWLKARLEVAPLRLGQRIRLSKHTLTELQGKYHTIRSVSDYGPDLKGYGFVHERTRFFAIDTDIERVKCRSR